jgi:Phage major capsid protein E
MDAATLVAQAVATNQINLVANNPATQFGTADQPLVGSTLAPEIAQDQNMYVEQGIRYRTVVANDGTRYSPVQIKGNVLISSMDVKLADQDIGSEFTAREYDAFLTMLRNGSDMQGMVALLNWVQRTGVRPLVIKEEVMRWQMWQDALVLLRGNNGYKEDVPYSNPTDQRVTASAAFSDGTVDPMDAFLERNQFARGKGYRLARIFWSTPAATAFAGNLKIKQRLGPALLTNLGTLIGATGAATQEQIAGLFRSFGLPVPELLDEQYQTSTGTEFYLKRNKIVFFGTTDLQQQVQLNPDRIVFLRNANGYTGVGRAAGQATPGRVIKLRVIDDSKPPRIELEGWQTTLPVNQEPEGVFVLTVPGITP